eukprot:5245790-Karenia_brevis.AAC.1
MQECVSDRNGGHKLRSCVLETSLREFAIRDTMQVHNGEFGQRVHLDPNSNDGKALMSNPEDGWLNSCHSNQDWGVPVSGKGWGRP